MSFDPRRLQQRVGHMSGGEQPPTQQTGLPTPSSQQPVTQPPGSNRQGDGQARQISPGQQANPLVPQLSLPKAGGAIRGLGEKFAANPLTGVPSLTVPIATSPGRSGFGPQLALSYQAGSGNGPFALEWALSVPAIRRKTEKGLPRYDDLEGSDTFIISDAEDLVPALVLDTSTTPSVWKLDTTTMGPYMVRRYRPRVEGAFARIERLQHTSTGDVFWRAVTKNNVTSIYGQSPNRRIADPSNSTRVFTWLLEATYDDKGNLAVYEYKAENLANVDANAACEAQRRTGTAPIVNQYVKYIHYGNVTAYTPDPNLVVPASQFATSDQDWLFHVVFDYGEHDTANPALDDVNPNSWPCRQDPFSNYRPGFEIRTYRLCQRVLMFHTIPELDAQPYLVRSTDFHYTPSPVLTQLASVTGTGYLKDPQSGTYQPASLPTLDFTYTQASLDPNVHACDSGSLENLPSGLDGARYQWIDLDSEGLSGALSEQAGTWLYKRNLGQGRLAPVEVVATQPSLASLAGGRQQILDLAANGHKSLVQFSRPVSGYYARTQAPVEPHAHWDSFIPFASCPVIDWQDPNLRMIDLDGDGSADVLITEDELLTWYPSLAEAGFGTAERVGKPFNDTLGPALVFADGTESIYLADMSGDGLTDLVRIRNGEVSYWPNLGYGRFGPRVVMDGPPIFDYPDQFEQRRVRLADIDGSGTTDIVYLGSETITYWLNQSGNSWSAGQALPQFPAVDDVSSVMVVDLLGTGTSCIVWSSPLPRDVPQPMQYIDLMSGTDWSNTVVHGYKPYLLNSVTNNLGAETRIQYASSTRFYVADWKAGTPWITRIPFPVQVVTHVESHDAVSDSKLVTQYAYHHGYYDIPEREFRGFGLVEQWDTESFADYVGAGLFGSGTGGVASGGDVDLHLPPVHTKTWYHTGIYQNRENVSQYYAGEYYTGDPLATLLPDTQLPTGLSAQEERECCRALKGMVLRQEVYADDGSSLAAVPYSVSEHTYAVRGLQPVDGNRYSVVYAFSQESLDYHYERNSSDPRIGHALTLDVDDYGQVTKSLAAAYPRRTVPAPPPDLSEQGQLLITYSETDLINLADPNQPAYYRLGVQAERRSYEITGLTPANGTRFTLEELTSAVLGTPSSPSTVVEIPYATPPTPGTPQKRLLKKSRNLYYLDDLSGVLPLGQAQGLALPYAQYQLAFSPVQLNNVFGTRVTNAILAEGAYLEGSALVASGHFPSSDDGTLWWAPAGHAVFDPAQFYQPSQAFDPFGNPPTQIAYDTHALLVAMVTDPLLNTIQAANDYRLLRPGQITDPNGNLVGAQSDALGMVIASWETGKNGEGSSAASPSRTLDYSLFNWVTNGQPIYVHTRERETYDPTTRWLETYTYSDGFGRVIQAKVEAEPGLALARDASGVLLSGQSVDTTPNPRWVGAGRTVFDNKGYPIKQYEPFFSADFSYETEAQLVQIGVTPVLRYDPLGRLIRTDLPDGSYTKVEFDPWKQVTWDGNDTLSVTDPVTGAVTISEWNSNASALSHSNPEYQALQVSLPHADTPTTVHLDTLARTFLTIADNGTYGSYATRVSLDIEGNQLAVTDARSNVVLTTDYDQLSRVLHTNSPDAGEHWALADVAGQPICSWDSRGYTVQTTYDQLRRPLGLYVTLNSVIRLAEYTYYGESAPASADALANNMLGRVYKSFDGAGYVTVGGYDFKGNLLTSTRSFLEDYTDPVDWSSSPPPTLGPDSFVSSTTYDALNRPATMTAPDGSVVQPTYNEAQLLQTVQAQLGGAATWTPFVTNIDYDAKGQRQSITYGNGVQTSYAYDPYTFRLKELTTTRPSGTNPLQDLHYAYDPIGNITSISDSSQETVYINNQAVKPAATYIYDPVYRLTQATGREHTSTYGAGAIPSGPYDPFDALRCDLTNPNDLQAMQTYTENYMYDPVGNISHVNHTAGTGAWNRYYAYATSSNQLLSTSLPGDPTAGPYSATYSYDPHGNMLSMPHLSQLAWDFKNELCQVDLSGGGTAYYTYDSSGQRVRKVWVHSGVTEERVYLGGYERYRTTSGSGTLQVERHSLHLMDGVRRICLVETTTADISQPASNLPSTAIRYQLGNHLGSAVLELDENAAIISYEEYYPYGSTSYQAGPSTAETSLKRYRYTGKERDEETGLYYHGARYYACWLGRWTSCDPKGMADGSNLYVYVRSNPLSLTDPTGRQSEDENGMVHIEPSEVKKVGPDKKLHTIVRAPGNYTFLHPIKVVGSREAASASAKPDDTAGTHPHKQADAVDGAPTTLQQIRKDVVAEVIPADKSSSDPANEPSTPEHVASVIRVINYFLSSTGRPGQSRLENLDAARGALTKLRNENAQNSQSLILRDAQRYFYGTVAPYYFSQKKEMGTEEGKGEVDVTKPEASVAGTEKRGEVTFSGFVISAYADTAYNLEKDVAIRMGKEETIRSNPRLPASAVGGSNWYEFGSYKEFQQHPDLNVKGPADRVSSDELTRFESIQHERNVILNSMVFGY